jgi:hypothetical protein
MTAFWMAEIDASRFEVQRLDHLDLISVFLQSNRS